ncbi:MAG: hypothetical protein M3444_04720 [Acidobacteriota bacterium]|nr:hypothetical protein [Acidobacteriota bacterium]
MTHRLHILAVVIAFVLIGTVVTPALEKPNSVLAFERLTSLVGQWKGTQDGREMRLTYTLTSRGSALMEEFRAGETVMVTMFTVDGDHLIATHYCSVGNQPQMVTKAITDPSAKSLAFSLSHAYGMKTPADWHNTGLTVTLEDEQHLTQVWTYEYNGKTGTNTFHFTRER